MSTVSSGRVNVTPLRAVTAATLEDIRDGLANFPPDANVLKPGWAILDPRDLNIGAFGATPADLSDPVIQAKTEEYPERLFARYYFWVHDAKREKLLTQLGQPVTEHDVRALDAIDFLISKEEHSEGYLVLASTRNDPDLDDPIVSLLGIMLAVDDGSTFDRTTLSSLHVGGRDFFLWIVERREAKPDVDPTISIAGASALDTRDTRSRLNQLKNEIDKDRSNFLTAVVDGDDLGPLRFLLRIPGVPAKITLTLWADGSFMLVNNETYYSMKAKVDNVPLRATQDLAYLHLPMLVSVYDADVDWDTARRATYVEEARSKLANRYRSKKATKVKAMKKPKHP